VTEIKGRACHFPATAFLSQVGKAHARDILTPALAQTAQTSTSIHPVLVYHLQRRLYTHTTSATTSFLDTRIAIKINTTASSCAYVAPFSCFGACIFVIVGQDQSRKLAPASGSSSGR
jgi:hypothetical protein